MQELALTGYGGKKKITYNSAASCDVGTCRAYSCENDASETAVSNILQNLETIF